jgi:hypothetical protein
MDNRRKAALLVVHFILEFCVLFIAIPVAIVSGYSFGIVSAVVVFFVSAFTMYELWYTIN